MVTENHFKELKHKTLEHFWGYKIFRDKQEEIIDAVLQGKDSLVLLPTGGGKSLCYQLPALLLEGTCLVVSPLLALMKDQVYQLKSRGIEAEYISSELEDHDAEEIYSLCKEGVTKILYVSPERLINPVFINRLQDIEISFLAVDEAHCISEWGQDFRPGYEHIRDFRKIIPDCSCIALTATATPKVMEQIKSKLELNNELVFRKSFKRENIKILCEEISDKYQRIYYLLHYTHSSGIIYTRTRKEAEQLTDFLQQKGLQNVDYYHAGLSTKERHEKQNKWLLSSSNILVSTNAFGMGIDKEDVGFVIHYSPPASVENYYQEIGRAGRNSEQSYAYLFWNEQELKNFDDILQQQIPDKKEFANILTYLYSTFQITENEMPEATFELDRQKVRNFTKCSSAKINTVLNFLDHQEIIYFKSKKGLSSLELKMNADEIELLPKKDSYFIEMLLRSLAGLSSYKVQFNEQKLAEKIGTNTSDLKVRIKELHDKNHLSYLDGENTTVKFLQPRNDHFFTGKYWNLFRQIQKNKLQKWEEIKYFIRDKDYCKNRLILTYFGEKVNRDCGTCYTCEQKRKTLGGSQTSAEIIEILTRQPFTLEEISAQLNFRKKEVILDELITLLDSGKVKMFNFRTYMLA